MDHYLPLDLHYCTNIEFWEHYAGYYRSGGKGGPQRWTQSDAHLKYDFVNHIDGVWEDSLSQDESCIHLGHGSGYEQIGMAYHKGVREFILNWLQPEVWCWL